MNTEHEHDTNYGLPPLQRDGSYTDEMKKDAEIARLTEIVKGLDRATVTYTALIAEKDALLEAIVANTTVLEDYSKGKLIGQDIVWTDYTLRLTDEQVQQVIEIQEAIVGKEGIK